MRAQNFVLNQLWQRTGIGMALMRLVECAITSRPGAEARIMWSLE